MNKFIFLALLFIVPSFQIVSASEKDQIPSSIIEVCTFSTLLSPPTFDQRNSQLPVQSLTISGERNIPQEFFSHNDICTSLKHNSFSKVFLTEHDELTHQSLYFDFQGKESFSLLIKEPPVILQNTVLIANNTTVSSFSFPVTGSELIYNAVNNPNDVRPDDIAHLSIRSEFQGNNIIVLFASITETDDLSSYLQQASRVDTIPDESPDINNQIFFAQNELDDLSHQAIASAVQDKNKFYFIKTGGVIPILDESFRQFIDYGASVSFGAGKHINENLSLSVSFDIVMLTGDWSIGGNRESIEIAEESWAPGIISEPGQTTINPEDLPDANLGISYHSEGEAVITSSESLKKIDIHTDLYIFPVSINALYKLNNIGKLSPYIGGGLGYCYAVRDSDSKAVKSKYFYGPEYDIQFNNNQNRNGMLLNLLGGFNLPIYKNLSFIAEGNMTYYDLQSFDPILEITFKTPATPSSIGGNDVSTWSYEDPKRFGSFSEEFVGKFMIGLFMPF